MKNRSLSVKPAIVVFALMAVNLVVNEAFLAEHISIGFRLAPYKYLVLVFHCVSILAALIVLYRNLSVRITFFHVFLALVVLACMEITPLLANWYFRMRHRRAPVELIVRNTRDDHVPFVNAAGAFFQMDGYTIRTNSDGYRDREYSDEVRSGKNIIFIGDSVTFGSGVNLEDTFTKVVERGLDGVYCMNWGVGGYDLLDNIGNLRHGNFRNYKPKAIVYSYCLNDFSSASRTFDEKVGLMANVNIYCPHNILLKALKGGTSAFLEKELLKAVEMCREKSAELIVNILPARFSGGATDEVLLMAYQFIKNFVVKHRVPYIDAQYLMNDARNFRDEVHLNKEGHRRMGEIILSYLRESKGSWEGIQFK